MRARYLEENPELAESIKSGQMPTNAFYHAEVNVLTRAARENGGTLAGENLTVFGDRRLCNKL